MLAYINRYKKITFNNLKQKEEMQSILIKALLLICLSLCISSLVMHKAETTCAAPRVLNPTTKACVCPADTKGMKREWDEE